MNSQQSTVGSEQSTVTSGERFYRALIACIQAERVEVHTVVVTMAGLARAFGEIALLDEAMQRQHAGLFASSWG